MSDEPSFPLESNLFVHKVTEAKGEDHVVTVILKGKKTVVHDTGDGYTVEDPIEITLTVKCSSMVTMKTLGIDKYGYRKLLSLHDRDGSLSEYEGIVPHETLEKIRQTVPADILNSVA